MIENNFCEIFLWKDVMWCDDWDLIQELRILLLTMHTLGKSALYKDSWAFGITCWDPKWLYDIKHISVCLVPIQANKSMKWPCFYRWYAAWIPDPQHARCIQTYLFGRLSDPFRIRLDAILCEAKENRRTRHPPFWGNVAKLDGSESTKHPTLSHWVKNGSRYFWKSAVIQAFAIDFLLCCFFLLLRNWFPIPNSSFWRVCFWRVV